MQVETGSSTIFRFDNMLDPETCDEIYQYAIIRLGTKNIDSKLQPWHEGDSLHWHDINNMSLQIKIFNYRVRAEQLLRSIFGENVYIEFTDIVLWRTGRNMPRHRDDGYTDDAELRSRKFSSVLYINDDYTGGETFIKTETGADYVSKPKKGSLVFYHSSPINEHGVNAITSGSRVTLPIWYCADPSKSENIRQSKKIEIIKQHAGLV